MRTIFNSLRFRLILLVLMAVIPALLVTLLTGSQQRDLARVNAEENALRIARAIASYQIAQMEGARQLTLAISLTYPNLTENSAQCSAFLKELSARLPSYTGFTFIQPDGEIICTSVQSAPAVNLSEREYFQRALQSGEFVSGEATIGRLTGAIIMPFAMPIRNNAGEITSVFVSSLNMETVVDLAKTIDLPEDSALLVVDSAGSVLVRYPAFEEWAGQDFPNAPVIQRILAQPEEGRAEVVGLDGVQRFYAFTPVETGGNLLMVSFGIPTRVAFAAADQAMRNNMTWIGIIAIVALGVAWFGGDLLFLRVVSLTAERDIAEQKLRDANLKLEDRVAERTAELDRSNQLLAVELRERQRAVQNLREREMELEKMLVVVERSNRELESFAYITSHDLQEPLRKIQAFGDRLSRRYASSLDEEGNAFVQRMSASANRMQSMINDLLDYSRITTRAREFRQVDLNDVAAAVISDLELRITETEARLEVAPLPVILADESQMRQLLQNLTMNALKFRQPGAPPHIQICCEETPVNNNGDRDILLIVEDNGIGFDEKYLDRIFQPFQRLHSQDVFEGSGIGLAICRKIAERHGGSISAQSKPGSGSRFIVRLPRYTVSQQGDQA
jgi:signal transduction histidine kinase